MIYQLRVSSLSLALFNSVGTVQSRQYFEVLYTLVVFLLLMKSDVM